MNQKVQILIMMLFGVFPTLSMDSVVINHMDNELRVYSQLLYRKRIAEGRMHQYRETHGIHSREYTIVHRTHKDLVREQEQSLARLYREYSGYILKLAGTDMFMIKVFNIDRSFKLVPFQEYLAKKDAIAARAAHVAADEDPS